MNDEFYKNLPSNVINKDEKDDKNEKKKKISGPVTIKKQTFKDKLKSSFVKEDLKVVKDHIIYEMIIPKVKQLVVDTLIGCVYSVFFGVNSSDYPTGGTSRTKYNTISNSQQRQSYNLTNSAKGFDIGDVVLANYDDAMLIINELKSRIETYGQATVGDLYSMMDLVPEFTYYKYGWTDLREAGCVPVYNGYKLRLPTPRALNK